MKIKQISFLFGFGVLGLATTAITICATTNDNKIKSK
jgi:hypothetical protein